MPNRADIAYCAGLFEGEGSTNYSGKYGVRLVIKMTDLEPLEQFASIMGGKIYGPYQPKGGFKPVWEMRIANWSDVLRVAGLMYPRLGPRRRAQIDGLREKAPKYPKGVLVCPPEPVAFYRGYDRHRQLGIPPCEVCKESLRMWFRERNSKPENIAARAAYREKRRQQKGSESDSI